MAAQWGQGQQGFQYPMQTGYPGNPQMQQNPQFQPQNPQFQPQNPQFQPQQQFQSGGLGPQNPGGMLPQQTGFPGQRPMGIQQPQQTGFPGGSGFLQSQPTGFMGSNIQQQNRPPPPPVPPIPSQFAQPNQGPSFLNFPPPQQQLNNNLLSASPGFGGGGLVPQPTGYAGRGPLIAQPTGMIDPRLQMMTQTFMPINTSAPYGAGGIPQLPQQQQNLVSSMAQHNEEHRGAPTQQLSWVLTKAEKKKYNDIFRSWDAQNTKFIDGGNALSIFGASGLPKDDLARIWGLADINDRGKLNIAEFHVAMGLIYRRLNGMPIPEQLPPELVPPSSRDLDDSVDLVKELLKHETRSRSPASVDAPVSRLKNRSFNNSSPSLDANRDATIYKHSDSEPPGGFYKPRSRHVDRDAIRSRDDDDSPTADLTDMKRRLANTAQMLDRTAQAEANRTREDEELDQEMDDLKYRVKRVQDDLEYNARPPRTPNKEEERRRLERELLSLMHERIPEVERKIKAREERKEKEKRQWARDRDRANDRHGRYDDRDDYSRRNDDRDRLYSRGSDDRDRPYSRGAYDRDDRERDSYRRDRTPSRERDRDRDRFYDRPRSSTGPSPPPPAPAPAASSARDTPPIPQHPKPSPSPRPVKNMTPAERQAFIKAEGQRLTQARMAALGVTAPASTPILDTSVEDRLQQEKKEAEQKVKVAEKQAEERERARKERLDSERLLKEGKTTPVPPTPTPTATAPPPAPAPKAIPKAAPTPPKSRAPAPPPPRKVPRAAPVVASAPAPKPPAPVVKPPVPVVPSEPEIDHEEELLRAREAELRKKREEREAQFQAKLRLLEAEEEEATRQEEERYQARLRALKAKTVKAPTPPVEHTPPLAPRIPSPVPAPVPAAQPSPVVRSPPSAPSVSTPAISPLPSPATEKSTNPFTRLIQEGGSAPTPNGRVDPWSKPAPAPSLSPDVARSKSPVPNPAKSSYNTAPASTDDDWDEIKENDDSDDSSDDEIAHSRSARANMAQQLFGNILPRPASAAASAPSTPAPPPPPAAPTAPPAPTAPIAPIAAPSSDDRNLLMQSIQGGLMLRPTKTVDRSAPPVSGKVLGDVASPPHISASAPSPIAQPQTTPMAADSNSPSSHRQSVGWFADRAADAGAAPVEIHRLPSTMEDDEDDIYEGYSATHIPEILVDEPAIEPSSNLMADIDKSIQHRVRSLYAFEGDGPEDLSFGENLIITANPSKSGGDWWYGTIVSSSKSGLFPKTYVEVVKPKKAKAIYAYASDNSDELTFAEGDILSIVDSSEEEWWKAEHGGVVFIVPAAYLEVVEDAPSRSGVVKIENNPTMDSAHDSEIILKQDLAAERHDYAADDSDSDSDDSDSNSNYLSFDDVDDQESDITTKEARERERQLVLEAAGLIVNQDVKPPPRPKRRSAPAAPQPVPSKHKDLPPVPDPETEPDPEVENVDHEASLDDAFARYESFRNTQFNLNRLSVISTESGNYPASPTPTISSMAMSSSTQSGGSSGEGSGRYAYFLQFLKSGNKTPEGDRKSLTTLNISAPIMNVNPSNQGSLQDGPSRPNSPSFGMSWASLVDKTALEGIPPGERKRQEAIFELINTEVAYVRDLQLIVEVFYSKLLPTLSEKEITVVFANIEDILLTNTTLVSSLEDRQKECRLYVDKVGDILLTYMPNMGVYMEYCVNQSTAIKVLQSLRENNSELASNLQRLRDENPAVRNLDLSSYLLAPMQRITRYPLLIKQILQYTEVGEEYEAIKTACRMAEKLLAHINETIRDQEGAETLKKISQHLWVGEGRLDLTAPTRYMGTRKLLKQGTLLKAKSRRKLYAFLCSDILVLTDESMKILYRLPIPVAYTQVKESGSKNETTFVISQAYPRGGDSLVLRALSPRDCQQWIQEIDHAGKKARRAEEKVSRRLR
ncbi:hypothetical protein BYT27DRAFT_7198246 [Phlegmacium glaucopus]|nr:hypothetical protein BYT27DRAFT_7198246 [Phlegmacium glaucopus]